MLVKCALTVAWLNGQALGQLLVAEAHGRVSKDLRTPISCVHCRRRPRIGYCTPPLRGERRHNNTSKPATLPPLTETIGW
jgi:hypothetical protein